MSDLIYVIIEGMEEKFNKARNLRKKSTPQELKLWKLIKNKQVKNYKFKRQVPIGNYIVDFSCAEKKLIIEIDGGQHNTETEIIYDKKRTEYLEKQGYKVIRFWNNEIDNNIEGVYSIILEQLQ